MACYALMTIPRSRSAGIAARLTVGALAAVALTGCIKMDMDLTLDGDTASGSVIVAMDRSLLDMAGAEPEDMLGDLRDEADLPEDATVEPYEDDDYIGQRLIFEDEPLSEFAGDEMSISYDPEAGRYEVIGSMDMTDMAGDSGDMPAEMADALLESFDIVISITFPGEVTEHNGELSGNTVTWRPVVGEVNEMRAVASEQDGLAGWLIAVLVGLFVVIAAGLVALLALRKRARPATGQSEEQPDPEDVARA